MKKEKVVFRREYDPYRKQWDFLAVFPEMEAKPGYVCGTQIYVNKHFFGEILSFGWCEEISMQYYYETKVVHKNDKDVPRLLSALEERYEQKFKVVEKIMK